MLSTSPMTPARASAAVAQSSSIRCCGKPYSRSTPIEARKAAPHRRVIYSERGDGYSAAAVQVWFGRLYGKLGFTGASSHSGRRTFVTHAARKIIQCGGRLRDVQELAGHASLATTQRYIQGSTEAKQRVVALI
jgi:integrase